MTKTELIAAVAVETKQPKKVVAKVLEQIISGIQSSNKTQFFGFGTFEYKTRAAKAGRNPHTGEALVIPERTVMTFKASRGAKSWPCRRGKKSLFLGRMQPISRTRSSPCGGEA